MPEFNLYARAPKSQVTRRLFLGLAAAASTAPLIAACGRDSGTSASGELTFLNQSRGQAPALEKLTATYAKQTGVKVKVDTPGPDDFGAKLQSKAQSRNMPDIFSSGSPAEMAPYIKAGWALDLRSELDAGWAENFTPAAVQIATFADGNLQDVAPGVYSVHWESTVFGLLRNTAVYKGAGVETAGVPADTAEWVDQLKRIDKGGTEAFSVAASQVWALVQSHASNWLIDEEITAAFAGQESWKSDAWRNAFQLVVDLRDAGVIANDSIPGGGDDNPQVEASFFSAQNTATIFDGSWAMAVGASTAPDFTGFTCAGLSKAPNSSIEPRAAGGVGKGACINARGENVDEALKFVKWLTEPAQAKVFLETANIIPTSPEVLSGDLPEQVAGFAELVSNTQMVKEPDSDLQDAIGRGVQSLVLNERSIDEVLSDIESGLSS